MQYFFSARFFIGLILVAFFLFFGAVYSPILKYSYYFVAFFGLLLLLEIIGLNLFRNSIEAERLVPERMSNGDSNFVKIEAKNNTFLPYFIRFQEELPHQLNLRDFVLKQSIMPKRKTSLQYELIPEERGDYHFGNLNVFKSIFLGLLEKRMVVKTPEIVKVYPSYANLNRYDLNTLKTTLDYGMRKTRRVGHSQEFEQIKNYVPGDNIKHINWKATAKRNDFMINQYSDEKSKEVYAIIDTGRNMKAPFNGLALLDYAINSCLALMKNVLNSQDKAGMMSFSKKISNVLKADQKPQYIHKIIESLYAIKPKFQESDFSNLYVSLQRLVSHRALLFLFTNFENYDAFERQLPSIVAINKSHVLVVVFFQNTELEDSLGNGKIKDAVQKALIEKQINEKERIVSELNRRKVQSVLTQPQNLTIQLLNKYLEIKAKGLL